MLSRFPSSYSIFSQQPARVLFRCCLNIFSGKVSIRCSLGKMLCLIYTFIHTCRCFNLPTNEIPATFYILIIVSNSKTLGTFCEKGLRLCTIRTKIKVLNGMPFLYSDLDRQYLCDFECRSLPKVFRSFIFLMQSAIARNLQEWRYVSFLLAFLTYWREIQRGSNDTLRLGWTSGIWWLLLIGHFISMQVNLPDN